MVLRPSILNLAKAITPVGLFLAPVSNSAKGVAIDEARNVVSQKGSVMSNLRIWTLISGCWAAITCTVWVVPITLCAVALLSSESGVAAQEPSAYEFTLIADISGSSTVSLNNRGTVSFIAWTSAGEPAVFTGNGGPLTLLVDGNAPFSSFGAWNTSINASGTVAFTGGLIGDGAGIFTASRRGVNTIARTGYAFVALGLRPSINNAGTVAFLGSSSGEGGLFAGRGDAIPTLYYGNRPPSPFFTFGSPAINENGTLAFLAGVRTPGAPDWEGIFTGDGGPTATIADSRSGFFRLDSEPSINNAGAASFAAILTNGVSGIFVGDGGPVSTIADSTGPFSDLWLSSPVINNNGSVVFFAELTGGGVGIFTGPDPLMDKVIAVGDSLLGSVVTEFFLNGSRLGFNDRGEVAFVTHLGDGREVVVRATPRHRSSGH
jgi:hypothetical protein